MCAQHLCQCVGKGNAALQKDCSKVQLVFKWLSFEYWVKRAISFWIHFLNSSLAYSLLTTRPPICHLSSVDRGLFISITTSRLDGQTSAIWPKLFLRLTSQLLARFGVPPPFSAVTRWSLEVTVKIHLFLNGARWKVMLRAFLVGRPRHSSNSLFL